MFWTGFIIGMLAMLCGDMLQHTKQLKPKLLLFQGAVFLILILSLVMLPEAPAEQSSGILAGGDGHCCPAEQYPCEHDNKSNDDYWLVEVNLAE